MIKARVKETGKIVEVRYSHHSLDCPSLHYYKTQDGSTYKEESLDFNDTADYWTRLEHQYAGMAMQGLMTILPNIGGMEGRTPKDEIIDIATETSHALVEKLKEKEEMK